MFSVHFSVVCLPLIYPSNSVFFPDLHTYNEARKPDKRDDYFLDVDKWENIFLVRTIMLALAWGLLTGAVICLILALNEIC